MNRFLLIVAAIADLALAALLIAVSGFIFGSGPESMRAGSLAGLLYAGAVAACVALPFAAFFLARKGKTPLALALAFVPPAAGLLALAMPVPY